MDARSFLGSTTVSTIVNNEHWYDVSPPYQRGSVWKTVYKQELIKSILSGIPINTLHLVCKSDAGLDNTRWVLDGRQRIETLISFFHNKLIVPFYVDGELINFTWRSLQDPESPCYRYYQRVCDFQIQKVDWEYMDFDAQREIFLKINNASALSVNERLYCDNFMVRRLLSIIYQEVLEELFKKYTDKRIAGDHRSAAIRLTHGLLVLCAGYGLEDVPACRDLTKPNLDKSCDTIEKILTSSGINCSSDSSKYKQHECVRRIIAKLKKVVAAFEDIATGRNALTKKFEYNTLLDVLAFLYKKFEDRIFTTGFVQKNKGVLSDWLLAYERLKASDRINYSRRTTASACIAIRQAGLEQTLQKFDLDLGVKNTQATAEDVLLASLSASTVCPITKEPLTDFNAEVDHVIPCSSSSSTSSGFRIVSKAGNRAKSDSTLEDQIAIANYLTASK